MIKRILAGICDPQHTASVSIYAQELASRFEAEVTAIAVTDVKRLRNVGPVAIGAGQFAKELADERIENSEAAVRQSIDILARRMQASNIPYTVSKSGGDPFKSLSQASRYHDLMIFGLRGLFEHGTMGEPPTELTKLIESGVRPILAVGPQYREIKRAMIGYSGSIESAKTLRSFAHLNLWPDAKLSVVNFGKPGAEGPALLADARSYLGTYGFDAEIEFIDGSPKNGLLKQADEWGADLLVIGNSAKSLMRRRVFGETALNAIQESKLPLFLSQ